MKIVLLCKSWNHGKVLDILEALREQELTPHGIVALAPPKRKTTFAEVIRKTNELGVTHWLGRFLRRLPLNGMMNSPPPGYGAANGFVPALGLLPKNERPATASSRHRPSTIADYARQHRIEYVVVNNLNDAESIAALQRMGADILLLGGTPIIRPNVLAVPKVATLNVHMGLLPHFRGMNVAEWSVFSGAPVGVTVHQVDPGVDTGAILYREKIEVTDCPNIEKMRAKLSAAQHRVLAKCTRLLIENRLVPEPQQPEHGKQYYIMHEKLRKIVEKKLSQGYKWVNCCWVFAFSNLLFRLFVELEMGAVFAL